MYIDVLLRGEAVFLMARRITNIFVTFLAWKQRFIVMQKTKNECIWLIIRQKSRLI